MLKIAHRGLYNSNIIENTYEAISRALLDKTFAGVEFDIRITKDRKFIIYHNAIYNNKLISNTLYKELPRYVPLLEDILNINSSKIFLIEIKNILDEYDLFNNLLNKYQDKNIYVMSFSNHIIDTLSTYKHTYKLGILNYIVNTYNLDKIDFIAIINSLLTKDIKSILSKYILFSYAIINKDNLIYDDVYYII